MSSLSKTHGICEATGKRRYANWISAMTIMSRIKAVSPTVAGRRKMPVRIYKCHACKDFHLTSMTQRIYQKQQTHSSSVALSKELEKKELAKPLGSKEVDALFDKARNHAELTPDLEVFLYEMQYQIQVLGSRACLDAQHTLRELICHFYDEHTWIATAKSRGYHNPDVDQS
ncbi:hypothetical protein EML15_08940 [Corynebacterium sp. sy017]|uniref:hypothetical protein n=1 Tax=unclassified Corynebacterium TaxID=2624378 RepID=UPI001184E1CE|nr:MULTISPECIES: hypothetical protein [unclassified Corynebacterium]MBP3089269.1 hypothetical protein [Corynebacterium sp. sy017]TSD91026.1 hypothetical protein ELY17_09660 [Corynebacterium sp. SY003]